MSTDGGAADTGTSRVRREIRQNIIQQCYEPLSRKLLDRNGWDDEIELAAGSEVTAEAHENRTVLELVQNARDAIRKAGSGTTPNDRDGSVAVVVGPETLYVANTGEPFHLNDEEVLKRVRRLGQGKDDKESIGEKGVGMRSILALGERFRVHSTISHDGAEDAFSVEFTSSHPWAMLTRRYSKILSSGENELTDRIAESQRAPEHSDLYADGLERVIEGMDTADSENLALAEHDDWPDENVIMHGVSNGYAPGPGSVIEGLPELSPFKYPLLRDQTVDDSIVRTLLGQDSVGSRPDDALASRLSEDSYTTVVSVDYNDPARTLLFELFAETFGDAELDLDLPVEEWRDAAARESAHSNQQKQIWDECQETISREVLVLLGEIETIDLILVGDTDDRKVAASEHYHCQVQDLDADKSAAKRDLQLQRLTVSRDEASASPDTTSPSSEFHLYTKEWEHPTTDEQEDTHLRLLFEEPGESNDWRPAPKPLHLYYTIEDETTPFPFILHAPFDVQKDRQNLDSNNDKNAALLTESALQAFVIEAIEAIVDGESALRSWLPWLIMPLAGGDQAPSNRNDDVSQFVENLCNELANKSCVPTFGGAAAPPSHVLLEVSDYRLDAFDPLREYLDRHGHDEHRRLPAQEVITNGRRWLQTVEKEGVLESYQFRAAAERIDLTALLSRGPGGNHEDQKEDFITVLGDIWGIDAAFTPEHPDIALEVEKSTASAYFETIIDRLPEDESAPARELGRRHVPLIPALNYSGKQEGDPNHTTGSPSASESGESIGRLVRAIDRTSESALGQNRIVFREDSRQTQRTIGPPPEPFRVYLVPYRKEWYDALDNNAEAWGTSKFEGDTDIYRRVAGELGGYGDGTLAHDPSDTGPLEYLYNGYTQINRGRQDPSADLFVPIPYQGWHYHKRFSNSVDTAGIGNLLQGESFDPISDERYLHQLYIKQIKLPTSGGEWKPADQIVFGTAWIETFRSVAAQLDQADAADPFAGKRVGEMGAANDFRRWSTAIESAAEMQDDTADVLAPPDEVGNCLGFAASEDEGPGEIDGEDWFWPINFLLHLGVQVGPRIEWAWLNPVSTTQSKDRRPRALSLAETRHLSNGSLPETDPASLPITPTCDELARYADVCRQGHNHPAFAVNHAPKCEKAARQSYGDWSIDEAANGSGSVAIPMWWRFMDPPTSPTVEMARAFRNAVLSLWPELSDRLFPTGWACTGAFSSGHQVKSPSEWIPSLGVVQLRRAALWPSSDPADDGENAEAPGCLPAAELVDGHQLSALRQLDRGSIEEAWPSELEQDNDSLSLTNVAPEKELQTWLETSLSELAPSAAAAQLDTLLDRFTTNATATGGSWYGQVRNDAFKLLRQFSPGHRLGKISDDDIERQWIRRDIYHTETQLIVDEGDRIDTVRIGDGVAAEATVYQRALPDYAEEQLRGQGVRFVRLPTTNPGPIASVLADNVGASDPVEFGITNGDVPPRPTVSGDFERDTHEGVSEALSRRVADLAAAYAVESTESSQEDVQRIEKQLDRAAENVCVISEHDVDGYVRDVASVKWLLGSDAGTDTNRFGIALVKDEIDGEPEPYHAVDALVDIVENETVKDKFEVILRAEPGMERYVDTREEYGLGNIERNEIQRLLGSSLPAIATGLSRGSREAEHPVVSFSFDEPDDETTIKAHHEALTAFAADGTHGEIVEQYMSELTRGTLDRGQAEACLRAAVCLTFERDNHGAIVTLINLLSGRGEAIVTGITAIADEVETVNLDDWRAFNATSLREYLTAAAIVEEFYSLLRPEHDESDIRQVALTTLSQADMLCPSPLKPIADAFPEAVRAELGGDQSLPVLVFALLDELTAPPLAPDRYPEKLVDSFTDWCRDQHDTTADVLAVSLEEWRLADPLSNRNISEVLPAVEALLDSTEQSTARQQQRTRKKKERAFDQGDWSSDREPSIASAGSDLDFPEIGDGTRTDAGASEFTGGDGRAGELYCIDQAWRQFQAAGERQASIIEAVSEWRNSCHESDQWRLKETADVFSGEDALTDASGAFAFAKLRDRLCDSDEDWQLRRKWFRMLVDTSEERGPGFDYMDPFGPSYGPSYDAREWEPAWMRRVEVKSVTGTPDGNYRVTLTGNEFRMARRSCDLCDGRRYLVRLVFGTWRDDEFQPRSCRDIDDILTAYTGDADRPDEAEARAWDALRGGEVPLRGSFEKDSSPRDSMSNI